MNTQSLSKEFVYGVDWSSIAKPTSHCWFECLQKIKSIRDSSCQYPICNIQTISLLITTDATHSVFNQRETTLLQCASCSLIIHSHHIMDELSIARIPSCRLSFVNDTIDASHFDKHYWQDINVLKYRCNWCKRKSNILPSSDNCRIARSPMNTECSSAITCLWCSRSYHRQCFEKEVNPKLRSDCDYGEMRNIIVRPQWIKHIPHEKPYPFKAKMNEKRSSDLSESYSPVLIFINIRSGGQTGRLIYPKLLKILNPRQIFLIDNNQTIFQALEIYKDLVNTRICVFGGDGSVGWVISRLADFYQGLSNPAVGICPLGTGNDLSRVLNWGAECDTTHLKRRLIQISTARQLPLDRWRVELEVIANNTNDEHHSIVKNQDFVAEDYNNNNNRYSSLHTMNVPKFIRETNRPSYQNHTKLPNSYFIDYMSFGLDAAVILEFHDRRTRKPEKFTSRLKNKLIYINEGRKYVGDFAMGFMRRWDLSGYIRLICDDVNFTNSMHNCHTLVVSNIPSYEAGTNPWGESPIFPMATTNLIFDKTSMNALKLNKNEDRGEPNPSVHLHNIEEASSEVTIIQSKTKTEIGRQNFGDQKLEVFGLTATDLGLIHVGFRGIRITQCSQLRIELATPMTVQMDGEPFYIPAPVAIKITHSGQVMVLRH
ncbi:unnamed protein product [Didymodactylos carnosus]|uniref:Diacylglycerol kinase n=1 Tax=Didymodactylos carnosus TaxID=1234261 RepID=A0A8S2IDS3_9BILA|nr:unnamed protein product [Didymodactylos carnosus]CAF3744898.1 unnamed protein product [Didymodactylos carnosus]